MFSISEDVVSKSEILGKLWRAAHSYESVEDGDACLPDICQELDSWVGSEHVNPRKRMSLRTSAVLIDGAAKVYKRGMEQLLQDVDRLDREIITRRRQKTNNDVAFTDSSEYPSHSISTPEQMMRQSGCAPEIFNMSITKDVNTRNSSIKHPRIDHSLRSCTEPSRSSKELAVDKMSDLKQTRGKNICDDTESDEEPRNTSERDTTTEVGSKSRTNTTGESKSTTTNHKLSSKSKPSSNEHGCSSKRVKRTDNSNTTESDGLGNTGADLNKSFIETNLTSKCSDESEAGGKSPSVQSFIFRNSTDWQKIGDGTNVRKNVKGIRKTAPARRDQASQTCFPLRGKTSRAETEGFDKSLPFGYLLIHDHYGSRVPSKIVLCSLNPQVKDLLCS